VTAAAGLKVGVMVSAVANGPKTIAMYSEKKAEIKTLRISAVSCGYHHKNQCG